MSEVNQAFLRAYLKNRASQSLSAPSAPTDSDTQTTQNASIVRTGPAREMTAPATQPPQNLPSGAKLRFDPSHAEPGSYANPKPVEPTRPKQGVWSALGAERGMKALESTSAAAYVRNGIPAVSNEAAQYRPHSVGPVDPPKHIPAQIDPPKHIPAQTQSKQPKQPIQQVAYDSSTTPAATDQAAYDQVMYVDGLAGHTTSQRLAAARPSERALVEMTEPIAFGTGATSSPSIAPAKRSLPPEPHVDRRPHKTSDAPIVQLPTHSVANMPTAPVQPAARPVDALFVGEAKTTRRFDNSHGSRSVQNAGPRSEQNTQPPKVSAPPQLPTALPLPVALNPSWEVDQFFWPEVVKHIETAHADAFQQIGKHLSLANRDGLKVMAITSGERGVGRSTVAMHMARCAASAGLRVALIDGDTFCPSLVDQLRLDMQYGWQDCLFENVPLNEIAIHSISDNMTLFPLTSVVSQQQMHANLHRMAKLIRRISTAFDMVFIDANRLNLEQRDMVGVAQESIVDAAIVVVDTELSIKEKVDTAVSILQGMGISSIGLVENFQS
ncbi:MAG: P-loop NTPase [Planctomycetota bacterium]|nr:P-loop NTPase [Planctomycetota bacterium]